MLWWGRRLGHQRVLGAGVSQRASEGGPPSRVAVQHPDVSSECGAHGLCVVKVNPAACHLLRPKRKSCFHPPFLAQLLTRSHLHLVLLSPEVGQLSTFLHLPALSP